MFFVVDDITAYINCQRHKDAARVMESASAVTQTSHTIVRNNIIFRLAVANAHRTGCLTNLTVAEFQKAVERAGHFVVLVHDHKTQ